MKEVILCKDCKNFIPVNNTQSICDEFGGYVDEDDFCSRGEKREDIVKEEKMKVYELMNRLSRAKAGKEVTAVVCLNPSVMLSIKPKWCELIAKGRKTIEFRKSKPNLETPFKCYIYCTKNKGISFWTGKQYAYADDRSHNLFDVYGNGKVIGEFVCDYILEITPDTYGHHEYFISDDDLNASCLTTNDLWEYGSGKTLYGWHISDLVIYDEPRELSKFWKAGKCPYVTENGCTYRGHCSRAGQTNRCGESLARPPQSWCYVEGVRK